jgi:hypothetical protein
VECGRAAEKHGLAGADGSREWGFLVVFLLGCIAAAGAGRSTRRMLKLVGLVGSIAACLRLLEMEIGTNAIGLPFWMGESEVAGVDLLVPFRLGAALVGGRIRQKERASARCLAPWTVRSLFCVTCFFRSPDLSQKVGS